MPGAYDYPAEIEPDEDGRFVVTFPDFGWGATGGAALDEALAEARDLLRELLAQTMREGRPLSAPIARQAARYEARRRGGAPAPGLAGVEYVGQRSAPYRRS